MIPIFGQRPRSILSGTPFNYLTKQQSDERLMMASSSSCIININDCIKYFQQKNEQNYDIDKMVSPNGVIDNSQSCSIVEIAGLKNRLRKFKSSTSIDNFFLSQKAGGDVLETINVKDEINKSVKNQVEHFDRSTSPISIQEEEKLETSKLDRQNDSQLKSSSNCSNCDNLSDYDGYSSSCSECENIKKEYDSLKQDFLQRESAILSMKCELNVKDKDIEEWKAENRELRLALNQSESRINDLQEKLLENNEQRMTETQKLRDEFKYRMLNYEENIKYYKSSIEKLNNAIKEQKKNNQEMWTKALDLQNIKQAEIDELQEENKRLQKIIKDENQHYDELMKAFHAVKNENKRLEEMKKQYDSYVSLDETSDDEYLEFNNRKERKEKHLTMENVQNIVANEEHIHSTDGDIEITHSKLKVIQQNFKNTNHTKVLSIGEQTLHFNIGDNQSPVIEISIESIEQLERLFPSLKTIDKNNIPQESENTHNLLSIFAKYKTEKEDLTRELKEKLQEIESLQEQLNQRVAELKQKADEVQELSQLRIELDQKNEELSKKVEEIDELNRKLKEYVPSTDMEQQLEDFNRLKEELQKATELLKDQEKEQQIVEENVQSWKAQLESENDDLKTALSNLNNEKENVNKELQRVLTESQMKDEKIEQLSNKMERLEDIKKKIEHNGMKLNCLEKENEHLKREIDEKTELIRKCNEKIKQMAEDKAGAQLEIESYTNKVEQLEKQIRQFHVINEKSRQERDTMNHFLVIYHEISEVCEKKWNLEENLTLLKSQLKVDQSENRQLEIDLKRVEGENNALIMKTIRIKESIDRLRDFMMKKVNDDEAMSKRFKDIFERLNGQIMMLKERCQWNDTECANLRDQIQNPIEKEDKLIQCCNTMEDKTDQVNLDEDVHQNNRVLNEKILSLENELEKRELQYAETMKSERKKFRDMHNQSIFKLINNCNSQERNPRILLENEEWLKTFSAEDLSKLYEQVTKYLNPEFLDNQVKNYIRMHLDQRDAEIRQSQEIIKSLENEVHQLDMQKEDLRAKLLHEEKFNEHLMERIHGPNKLSSHLLSEKINVTSNQSSTRKSYCSSEYSESDVQSNRSSSKVNKRKSKKTSSSLRNKCPESQIENFIRMSANKLEISRTGN